MTTPPDQTVKDLAHLAFCALLALQTVVQRGTVKSPMAEHLFLVRWLAKAQKQKRFPRSVWRKENTSKDYSLYPHT